MAAEHLIADGVPQGCHLFPSGCGFPAPGAGIFDFTPLWKFQVFGIDFGIGKPIILLLIACAALVIFFVAAFRNAKVVPGRLQSVGEYGYLFVRDGIARDTMGKAGDAFVPLLFALFFLVWVVNFLGIVPFAQFAPTSRFAIPVAFAAIVYLLWVPVGMIKQGPGKFMKMMTMPPDVPKLMYVLLIPIEFVSNFLVRPFTHSVRLFANMFAGHLLIVSFSVAAWYLWSPNIIGIAGSIASLLVAIVLVLFEILIQALQAYVFALLTAVYINDALHAH